MDTSILRELFLQRLPTQVRMILSTSMTDSIAALARMADQIMDVSDHGISALQQDSPSPRPPSTEVSAQLAQILDFNTRLEARVDQLSQELRNLRVRPLQCPNGQENSRRHSSSSPDERTESEICWFHRRYGRAARQCRPPCTYSGNGTGSR